MLAQTCDRCYQSILRGVVGAYPDLHMPTIWGRTVAAPVHRKWPSTQQEPGERALSRLQVHRTGRQYSVLRVAMASFCVTYAQVSHAGRRRNPLLVWCAAVAPPTYSKWALACATFMAALGSTFQR